MVCPWNRFAGKTYERIFAPRPGLSKLALKDELGLTTQEFNRKFKGSPILRARRRGYLRNVAVALGNSDDSTAIPILDRALQDNEPLIREHAVWALEQIHNN
jgi:epoxyqueuosine reductase